MNVALIPVRGGSKSIPLKNIKKIAGQPLVYWVLRAASECSKIDKVYVATDSDIIRRTVERFELSKVEVIARSAETATDTASTESVMLEFAQKYDFDNIVLIQATSPLLTSNDLNGGFELFNQENVDSVLSVVRQKRFIWEDYASGAKTINYDVYQRPRRQEFDGYLVENGAFYITGKESLLQSGNRVSGIIRCYEMDERSYFEIDEPSDWQIIEQQLLGEQKKEITRKIPNIKMFLTDCDGCLTDGGMYYSENGDELKKFNAKDGMGFELLKQAGIITGIVTGEEMQLNARRAKKLNLDNLEMGIKDKMAAIRKLCKEYGVSLSEVAYVGDDINDVEAIQSVGFGCSVANGIEKAKQAAKYVSVIPGGSGAVREIIDMIVSFHE